MRLIKGNFWLTDKTKMAVLVILMLSAFFLGGSSRHDTLTLILLRPISVLLTGWALYIFLESNDRRLTLPLMCLLALFGWILLQLIPLPSFIWQSLPGRSIVAEIDALRGAQHTWRPLTLSPSRTVNSLFAIFMPLGVLLLIGVIKEKYVDWLLPILVGLGFASALVGMAQILGPTDGPLYFYKITNSGLPVGMFANRNHHAIFLASLVPLVSYVLLFDERLKIKLAPRIAILTVALVFMVVLTLMTGSRAGSLLIAGAIIMLLLFAAKHFRGTVVPPRATARMRYVAMLRRYAIPATGVLAVFIVGLTLHLSDSEAIARLNQNDTNSEVRFKTLPYVADMAWAYLPFGSGFGSFEFVYKIIEPDALLTPSYFNQAHNDILQVIIEGGIPAVAILAVFLWWLAKLAIPATVSAWRAGATTRGSERIWRLAAVLLAIIIVLLGGIADYPVRTPLMMSYVALLTGVATRSRHS
ncbi:MAG: hypothetical protein C0471_15160 [Erythrobacter sp.]|nr:hypothetical protein [Erythrobacter sp.]